MEKNIQSKPSQKWRKTTQKLVPVNKTSHSKGKYDLYPAFELSEGQIERGFTRIAKSIEHYEKVVIDGYAGVFWDHFRKQLTKVLKLKGYEIRWLDISEAMLDKNEIDKLIAPFLGGDDPIFGTRFTGGLDDFFHPEKLQALRSVEDQQADITILYGCGAELAGWDAPLIYVDLPKNELQFRSRAQSVTNLGASKPDDAQKMYKRFYFVDWIALNRHKREILPDINWMVDEQHPDSPAIMEGSHFREALHKMSRSCFRVRPWFEPGVWGGQWCSRHIPDLPQDVPNYAWSFEMITHENGLLFSSDGKLLEVSFDWLMYRHYEAVLGESADQFGYEFPIRFDFLDTVEGGNLSVQCHPNTSFIRENFGESLTQDETYYILDSTPDAKVYLGFEEDINPDRFRKELEYSNENNTPVDIGNYVQAFQSKKHDFFLIPNETIHYSGEGNMVLEISAAPYIFTFKMYDWLRTGDGDNTRPINIERAFENLNFDRKGKRIEEELVSSPIVIKENNDSRVVHLPTHEEHFYDIHRLEFADEIEVETNGSCHVMSLVEGSSIILKTRNGFKTRFNYAETFTIPAAAESYRIINKGEEPVKVVKAFIKPDIKLEDYQN